jgi:hypothetical protein
MRFVKGDQIRGKRPLFSVWGPKYPSSTLVHDFWVINSKMPRVGTGAGRVRRNTGGGGRGRSAATTTDGQAQQRSS